MSVHEFSLSLWRHARLFRPGRRAAGDDWPALSASRSFRADPRHLQRFLALCPGWDIAGYLPPTYPQVVAVDLHLRLLGDAGFPWQPLGLVHLSNHIDLLAPLSVARDYHLSATLAPAGEHRKGVLASIRTELHADEQLLWRASAIVLKLTTSHAAPSTASPRNETTPLPAERSISLAEDLGRRYARIAGDLNPIHQRAWMARPFGFRRHILHGMWTLAWSIQPLVAARHDQPTRIDASFLRPVYLPNTAHVGTRESGEGMHGQLWTADPAKPALEFSVGPCAGEQAF